MSGFSADWLGLREPVDARSRSAALVRRAVAALKDRPLEVVDLATGGGANVRYLLPHFGREQHWLLIDDDYALLRHLPHEMQRWARSHAARVQIDADGLQLDRHDFACRLQASQIDLAGPAQALDPTHRDLITAAALLDLVSEPWLRSLVASCWSARSVVLFALTYDGRIGFTPSQPQDEMVRELVNRHQRTDKSFGPALGPDASDTARRLLQQAGFDTWSEHSDWELGAADAALQLALIDGWADASRAIAPHAAQSLEQWRECRRAQVRAGHSRIIVGHSDLLAIPPTVHGASTQVAIE